MTTCKSTQSVLEPLRLETRRLHLRQFEESDLPSILRLHRHPDVVRLLIDGVPTTPAAGYAYLRWLQQIYQTELPGPLHASRRRDGYFLGSFSLCRFEQTGELELGGRLFPLAWGKNYGLEGGHEVLRYGFDVMAEKRVIALADPANRPVRFVLARLGFSEQERIEAYGRPAIRSVQTIQQWRQRQGKLRDRRAALERTKQPLPAV